MDVSPCNSLLDLWFIALVLSRTLNGSSEGKGINKELKGRQYLPAFIVLQAAPVPLRSISPSQRSSSSAEAQAKALPVGLHFEKFVKRENDLLMGELI